MIPCHNDRNTFRPFFNFPISSHYRILLYNGFFSRNYLYSKLYFHFIVHFFNYSISFLVNVGLAVAKPLRFTHFSTLSIFTTIKSELWRSAIISGMPNLVYPPGRQSSFVPSSFPDGKRTSRASRASTMAITPSPPVIVPGSTARIFSFFYGPLHSV